MIANFYLIPASFQRNNELSIIEIEEKIKALHIDIIEMKKYKEKNKFFVHRDIYDIFFINNITIFDFLFNNLHIDTDVKRALQKIIYESANVLDNPVNEIIDLLPNHNNENCYGLITFNIIENIDKNLQIIYNLNNWYTFRRYFLGLYPKNGDFFINECKIYFPTLFFHERNKITIMEIIDKFPKKIVFHLTALIDKFNNYLHLKNNRTEMLKQFSINEKLDEIASPEGNPAHKNNFTFDFFIDDSNNTESVYCELHLKLCHSDNYPGDSHYYKNRIYFHEGKPNIQNGKILIGHIGKHL